VGVCVCVSIASNCNANNHPIEQTLRRDTLLALVEAGQEASVKLDIHLNFNWNQLTNTQ
jgi:hypothetical protein